MRPEYSRLEPGFFDCRVFESLGDDYAAQLVRVFVTAGHGAMMSGVQRTSAKSISAGLGMGVTEAERCLERLAEVGFCLRDGAWIFVTDKAAVNVVPSSDGSERTALRRMWAEVALCPSPLIVSEAVRRYGVTHRLAQHSSHGSVLGAIEAVCDPEVLAQAMQRVPVMPARDAGASVPHGQAHQAGPSRLPDGQARHPDAAGASEQGRAEQSIPAGTRVPARGESTILLPDPTGQPSDRASFPDWQPGEARLAERRVGAWVEKLVGQDVPTWVASVEYVRRTNPTLKACHHNCVGYGGLAWVRVHPLTGKVVEVVHVYAEPAEGVPPYWEAEARREAWAAHLENSEGHRPYGEGEG